MPAPGTSPSEVEVEWQFDALDLRPVERWLAQVPVPGGTQPGLSVLTAEGDAVVAEALPSRRLVDAYLDTTDWRIGRSGFVLRVRRRAGGAEVTLKDTSPATAGLRRRLEVTEPLPAGGVGSIGPEGPVGRRLHALIGSRPLRQVLEVRTRRRAYNLELAGSRAAEVALDDTVIEVSESTRPVRMRRVEVEVDPTRLEAMSALVSRLRSDCGLQPATLSKFEAGLLASGLRIPGGPELGTLSLPPAPSVGELAFVVLRRNFAAMLAHEAGTRLGEDPEELHDMRVATRRMRAALAMFADALPARSRHIRSELGWLADVLGAVRDLDVQLERVGHWSAEVPEQDRGALGDLSRLLSQHRQDARGRLLASLESSRYERLVTTFTAMLCQGPSRRLAAARAPAAVAVPDLVRARHRAVTKAARRARRRGAPDDFHILRIRCKRLRYALEFVAEIYRGQTTKYVRDLVGLQDRLGSMQDARVAAERLHALVVDEGPALSNVTVFVMGGVAQRYRQEAAALAGQVPKKLDGLTGSRWQQMIGHMDRRRLEAAPAYGWSAAAGTKPPPASPGAVGASAPPPGPPGNGRAPGAMEANEGDTPGDPHAETGPEPGLGTEPGSGSTTS